MPRRIHQQDNAEMLASDRAVSRFYPGSAPRLQSRLSTWAPGFLSIKRLHSSPITVRGNPGRSRRLAIYRPQVVFIGPYLASASSTPRWTAPSPWLMVPSIKCSFIVTLKTNVPEDKLGNRGGEGGCGKSYQREIAAGSRGHGECPMAGACATAMRSALRAFRAHRSARPRRSRG